MGFLLGLEGGANYHNVARLDRFLYSVEWEENFRNSRQQIMPRLKSNHNPIVLKCGDWETEEGLLQIRKLVA